MAAPHSWARSLLVKKKRRSSPSSDSYPTNNECRCAQPSSFVLPAFTGGLRRDCVDGAWVHRNCATIRVDDLSTTSGICHDRGARRSFGGTIHQFVALPLV